jgi:hypothetical protein
MTEVAPCSASPTLRMRVLDEIDRPNGRVVPLIVSNDGGLALVLGRPLQGDVVVNGGPGRDLD